MHDEIGVTADGRRKVSIFFLGETVMAEWFDGIPGAHQRLEKANLEGGADGQPVELLEQALDFAAVGKVAALDFVAEDFFAKFLEPFFVRRFVDAIHCRAMLSHQAGGGGFVGQKHELFDELMRDVVVGFFDARNSAFVVQKDFGFGKVEVKRASAETIGANLPMSLPTALLRLYYPTSSTT